MSGPVHSLDTLRAAGAHAVAPARFRYLEALEQRLRNQPPLVQQVLQARLQRAVDAYAAQCAPGQGDGSSEKAADKPFELSKPSAETSAGSANTGPHSPLAQLNRELSGRATSGPDAAGLGDAASPPALKSVTQFGDTWSRISAEQQVVKALHRAPDNAGPLNAHKLVLRTLSLMRSLSPDYLRHFMSQAETLLWLDQASARPVRPAAARATPAPAIARKSARSRSGTKR